MTDEARNEFPYEERCAATLREIESCPEFEVYDARLGDISPPLDEAPRIFDKLANRHGLSFGQEARDHFFRFDEVETYWRLNRPDSELVGEFHLTHVYRSVMENGLHHTWEGTDDEERALHRELKVFDDTPRTGSGRMAMLRARRGTTDPEIWYFDMHEGAMLMDLGYADYLDTLLITKGTIGWQYLYCSAGFGDPGFTPLADGLKEMLDVFPRLFPEYDYSDLKARLRERT
ncbi:hypothetical protein DF19_12830 [Streptomyces olindensis]|nr:hypothetical protein DF19_12830 [Streptomyces olindensis]